MITFFIAISHKSENRKSISVWGLCPLTFSLKFLSWYLYVILPHFLNNCRCWLLFSSLADALQGALLLLSWSERSLGSLWVWPELSLGVVFLQHVLWCCLHIIISLIIRRIGDSCASHCGPLPCVVPWSFVLNGSPPLDSSWVRCWESQLSEPEWGLFIWKQSQCCCC